MPTLTSTLSRVALLALVVGFSSAQYRQQANYPQYNNQQQQQQQNPYQRQQQQGYQPQQQNGFQNSNNQQQGQQNRYQPQQQSGGFGQQNQQPQQQSQFNGYNQQGFYNQQSAFQQQQVQNGASAGKDVGRSAIVNQPVILSNSTYYGATVYFRIIAYSNNGFMLSNSTTCRCPSSTTCSFLPSNQQNRCNFGFTVIFSSSDQSATYISTDFFPYTDSGITNGNWSNAYTLPMASKPVAIDVFVQNLGEVIDISTSTPTLAQFNYLTHVDTFVVSLSDYTPAASNGQPDTRSTTVTGQDLRTQIQIQYSIQCNQGVMGPNCDLTCGFYNATSNSDYNTICQSNQTGAYWACTYNTQKTQVSGCQLCQNGTTNGTCTNTLNAVSKASGVSKAFRTWTIVLAVLLFLAVIFIILLVISYIIIRNREDPNVYKSNPYPSAAPRATTQSSRPLLDDEWSAPPRTTGLTRGAPLASEHETSRNSDVRDSESYVRNGAPTMSRQEHQV